MQAVTFQWPAPAPILPMVRKLDGARRIGVEKLFLENDPYGSFIAIANGMPIVLWV